MLALQLAQSLSVSMHLCTLAYQDIAETVNCGWGGRDSQSFIVLQQERAGVPEVLLSVEEMSGIEARS